MTYFENAFRHGSPFETYYYLAEIHATNAQNAAMPANLAAGSCAMAVSFYKLVAERGTWLDDLVRDGEMRWREGSSYAKEDAILRWWVAAERGFEAAQNNMAYVLDQGQSRHHGCLLTFASNPEYCRRLPCRQKHATSDALRSHDAF